MADQQSYMAGNEDECTIVDPRRSLQRLPPSLVLFSALGLLPALLFEREANADFCKTPVGDEPIRGLLSHL